MLLVADGRSIHTQRLATALADAGVDVHLAAFSAPPSPFAGTFHALRPAAMGDVSHLLAIPHLSTLIRRLRPAVVHAHYISSYGLMAALAAPPLLVSTAWGSDLLVTARRGVQRRLASFSLRRATLATGDSQSLLDEIAHLAPATARHRFVFGPPRALFGAHRKDALVLSPRNHEDNYQIDLVLDAWRIAQPSISDHRLVVAGSGSRTDALRRRAAPGVEFTGAVPYEGMLDLVRRSRLVVSVPRSDATSAAVLEALAAGCSVVASDLPANAEWVPATHRVPVDADADDVAGAILRCRAQPLTLDAEWSIESQTRRLLAALERLA